MDWLDYAITKNGVYEEVYPNANLAKDWYLKFYDFTTHIPKQTLNYTFYDGDEEKYGALQSQDGIYSLADFQYGNGKYTVIGANVTFYVYGFPEPEPGPDPSSHEKVFGVCENKCFVEVLPKDKTVSKDELDEKFKVIQGTALSVKSAESKYIEIRTDDLDYDINDYMVIGAEQKVNNSRYAPIDIANHVYPSITVFGNYLRVYLYNTSNSTANIDYKIALMKIV